MIILLTFLITTCQRMIILLTFLITTCQLYSQINPAGVPLIPELLNTDVFYTFNRGRMYKVPADTILAYILREGTFGVTDGDKGDVTVSAGGTVWDIDAGVVGPTELENTAVTPGSYVLANVTVDADGRLTNVSNGTVIIPNADYGDITVSSAGTVWNIDPDAVGSAEIATDAVGASEIATDAVGAAEIAANAVGSSELASTTVTPGSYTLSSITVDSDGRLTAASNGSGVALTDGDKGDITVSSSGANWQIDANSVGVNEIATDGVGAAEIAADAVGASEIAANAVGASELASTAVTPGSYTSTNLTVDADGRITAASNGSSGASALTTYSFSFSDSFTPGVHTYIQSISGFPTVTINDIAVSNGYTLSAVDTGSGMTLVSGHKDFRDLTGTITSSYFVDGAGYYFVYYGGYWQIVTRD